MQAILDGMHWVGLDYDEGPFYQTQRFDRYKDVIQQLLASGHAYLCYCSKEELDAMRAEQEARGEKPRYDRRWRPEDSKTLPTPPAGVPPVVRFKTRCPAAWPGTTRSKAGLNSRTKNSTT